MEEKDQLKNNDIGENADINLKDDSKNLLVERKGKILGTLVMAIIVFIVTVLSFIFMRNNFTAVYAVMAMFWGYFSADCFPKFMANKDKTYLFSGILYAVASIGSLVAFIISVF
ncbi:MAG: DUF6442 family protein [Clostridia bacterium]